MHPVMIFVVTIIIVRTLLGIFSDLWNIKALTSSVPREFSDVFDGEKYAKSQDYLRAQTDLNLIESLFGTTLTLAFIVLGGLGYVDDRIREMALPPLATGLLFWGALGFLSSVIETPFSIYKTFVLEERFGFNRTTWKTYLTDRIKGLFLLIVIGAPIGAAILWFFETVPQGWLWAWAVLTVFQLAMTFLAPSWILPLFNKFTILEDGALKEEIRRYAQGQNIPVKDIFVMDGSKRSAKVNAFFTGFGKRRRIILFDTLISKLTTEELVSVLAHEIGHLKLKHIPRQMILSIVTSLVIFFLLSLSLEQGPFFEAFGVQVRSAHAGFVIFGFLYAPISFFLDLFRLGMSRKYEFESDYFAAQTLGRASPMISALKKLSAENLSNLTPHRLKVFLEYTHPPVLKRIEALAFQFPKS